MVDNQTSAPADRGLATLENYQFLEKISHFDRERIPERIVHARGFVAHGYFEAWYGRRRAGLDLYAGQAVPGAGSERRSRSFGGDRRAPPRPEWLIPGLRGQVSGTDRRQLTWSAPVFFIGREKVRTHPLAEARLATFRRTNRIFDFVGMTGVDVCLRGFQPRSP